MTSDSVLLSQANGIGTITINRPAQRNALNDDVRGRIVEGVQAYADDENIRVVVLRGSGTTAFASGADLRELGEYDFDGAKAHFAEFNVRLTQIEAAPIPVIAMISGYALGGACELAAACDLRVAADSARFGMPIGRIGHSIDKGNIRRLLRLISPAELKALIMTDDLISAQHALRIGLLNWVVPGNALEVFTYDLAARVAAKAPLGMQAAKKLVNAVCEERTLPGEDDAVVAAELFTTADFAEGVAAFLDKRSPKFTGR
ncbi:enoyl-CoA hydratase/isomerase family protein [Mycolicibacterium sp. XJ870]